VKELLNELKELLKVIKGSLENKDEIAEKKEAPAVTVQELPKINATSKLTLAFEQGQKVRHSILGEGIIAGFSSISGQPFVFFINQQNIYKDKVVCVDYLNLISME